MPRTASIFLPMWPIDLIRRRQSHSDGSPQSATSKSRQAKCGPIPILVIALERGVQVVMHCSEMAAKAGVVPGMTLAHAHALLHVEPSVEPFDSQRDWHSLRRLAMWAQRYSPLVAADPPDGLLLNITGCQRLFGGEERLARTINRELNRLGFQARVAIASTFACAAAVARAEVTKSFHVIPPGEERAALAPLPLAALRLDPATIDALHEIEIVRIGQLFDLPRTPLATRYGEELLLRLDQALGQAMEVIEPIRLKTPPAVQHLFEGPVRQIEGIEWMTRSLLERLAQQLLKLERGVCRLDVEFKRVDVPPVRLAIRLSHPSRQVKHLWSLLRPKIEHVNVGFGVEQITLTASRIAVLTHDQNEFQRAKSHRHEGTKIHRGELIDALSNRLGSDRVLGAEPFESHVPERSFRMRPAIEIDTNPRAPRFRIDLDRPTTLFPSAQPISVIVENEGPSRMTWGGHEALLIHSIGPEAIAWEWWKESPSGLREYYKVQDEAGHWLWIFYEHFNDRWFIHGVWA